MTPPGFRSPQESRSGGVRAEHREACHRPGLEQPVADRFRVPCVEPRQGAEKLAHIQDHHRLRGQEIVKRQVCGVVVEVQEEPHHHRPHRIAPPSMWRRFPNPYGPDARALEFADLLTDGFDGGIRHQPGEPVKRIGAHVLLRGSAGTSLDRFLGPGGDSDGASGILSLPGGRPTLEAKPLGAAPAW